MHALPSEFDDQILVGRFLGAVRIGPYVTYLEFLSAQPSPGSAIASIDIGIKGPIAFILDNKSFDAHGERPLSMTPLVKLLMREVTEVERIGRAGLVIRFKTEGQIMLDGDDSPSFESFTINIPGGTVIAV